MSNTRKTLYLGILATSFAAVLWFWWQGSGELFRGGFWALALGRLFGLLGAFFILLQIMLMGRARWLESVFGLDKLSHLHHLNGMMLLVFIIGHPLLIVYSYAQAEQLSLWAQFLGILKNYTDAFQAFVAVILFLSVIVYSIIMVRKKLDYELWHIAHLSVYVALALAFGHQLKLGGDFLGNNLFTYYWYLLYAFVLGNLILFRFLKPFWLFSRHRFYVKEVKAENGQVTSVYIGGENLQNFKIEGGQFMILRFLDGKRWWQAHPFSLSTDPNPDHLRVSMKAVGDFTKEAKNIKPGTKVLVEGAYGVFTAKASTKEKVLLIAGGIGITPIRSMVKDLAEKSKDITLLYSNADAQNITFKNELEELASKYNFNLQIIVTGEISGQAAKNRLDGDKIKQLSPDFKDRDIFICGPVPMMMSIKKALLNMGVPKTSIHYEKFSLG